MADVTNKIIRGTFGRLYVNGQNLANVKSLPSITKLLISMVTFASSSA